MVEKFTAHYVFALGLSRFISCAHWILQIVDGDSFLLQAGPAPCCFDLSGDPVCGAVVLRFIEALTLLLFGCRWWSVSAQHRWCMSVQTSGDATSSQAMRVKPNPLADVHCCQQNKPHKVS